MCDKDEIRAQIVKTLEDTYFPKKSHEDLIASLPEGEDTLYSAETVVMTAGAADKFIKESDFPFNDAEEVADLIVERCVFTSNRILNK